MSEVKAYVAEGRIGRVLAARLLPGQDVVEGIIEIIKASHIHSGTITAIGSLRGAKVVWAGSMEFGDNPMDVAVFHEMAGPVELGVSNGSFGTDQDGEVRRAHSWNDNGQGRKYALRQPPAGFSTRFSNR